MLKPCSRKVLMEVLGSSREAMNRQCSTTCTSSSMAVACLAELMARQVYMELRDSERNAAAVRPFNLRPKFYEARIPVSLMGWDRCWETLPENVFETEDQNHL